MKRLIVTIFALALLMSACSKKDNNEVVQTQMDAQELEESADVAEVVSEEEEEQVDLEKVENEAERSPTIGGSLEDISTQLFEAYHNKDYNKVLTEFKYDAAVKSQLTEAILVSAWNQMIVPYGEFIEISSYTKDSQTEFDIIEIVCKFSKGSVAFNVVFNSADEIAGFNFMPFIEKGVLSQDLEEIPVTFGGTEFPINGTIILPKGVTSCPMVILVHGSGPSDQDETIGANKPFKDIAWQLAAQGIGVLRYDKRTYTYGAAFAENQNATVYDETIHDVGYAYEFLSQYESVKADGIYILGHSLGGYLMPRIANEVPLAAGYIMLAAPARHLEDLMIEQINYISNLDGEISSDDQAAIDYFNQFAERVKKIDMNNQYTTDELMNVPPSYWLDLVDYDPIAMLKEINKPILILQGDRDYQVTQTDYNLWMNGLSNQGDVSFILYPGLNHLFMEGIEASTPDEYAQQGSVSLDVTDDIASWVISH